MSKSFFTVAAMTITTAGVFMMLLTARPAFALDINPCSNDFKQYCGDVTPGGGRLIRCYEQNKDKMSAACKSWAETAKMNANDAKKVCDKEINSFCNSEKGDPFEMLDCLQSNYINLSPECVQALNQFKYRYPKPAK